MATGPAELLRWPDRFVPRILCPKPLRSYLGHSLSIGILRDHGERAEERIAVLLPPQSDQSPTRSQLRCTCAS